MNTKLTAPRGSGILPKRWTELALLALISAGVGALALYWQRQGVSGPVESWMWSLTMLAAYCGLAAIIGFAMYKWRDLCRKLDDEARRRNAGQDARWSGKE